MNKALPLAGIVTVTFLAGCTSTMNHELHTGCTVIAKDILYSSSSDGNGGHSTQRIKRLSTSCGDYNVNDSVGGGFNSWDTWTHLEVGKKYDIETGGYRVGFFDSFPVVIKVTPAK